MNKVGFFACYDYNAEWLLVEMTLDEYTNKIDWLRFVVPEEGLDEEDWQCAFMEQYLNAEGTARICAVNREPKPPVKPCRFAFFLYKTKERELVTPYGKFSLEKLQPLPERLRGCIRFAED